MRSQSDPRERPPLDRAAIERYEQRLAAYESRRGRAGREAELDGAEPDAVSPRRFNGDRAATAPRARTAAGRSGARPGPIPALDEPTAVRREPPGRPRAAHERRRPSRTRLLIRRIVLLALIALVAGSAFSWTHEVLLQPSNVGVGVRSVEWLRNHGLAWLVSDVEAFYYSLNAPSKGGPALKALPKVGVSAGGRAAKAYAPPPIRSAVRPALAGEGTWRRTGPLVGGAPPVLVTTFRPDPTYPDLVAGVAWIDSSRTTVSLYPGRYEPVSGPRGPMQVPQSLRSQLVATFNSAFKLEDSGSGFYALNHLYKPLRPGLATLVGNRDGSVDVRAWRGGGTPDPQVSFARQNLPLILENGRLNPNLSDGPEWGATLGNRVRVWRSAVGIDRRGNLLYAAANNQTVASLAQILQRAGAVRAMELDINYQWVAFNTYRWAGAGDPSKLLSGTDGSAKRYLSPDDRDFFAVYGRAGH